MSIKKITSAERDNVRIYGLADRPGLTKEAMQQRFDGLGDLAIDKLNEMIDVVNSLTDKSAIVDEEGNSHDVKTVVENNSAKITDILAAIAAINSRLDELKVAIDEKVISVAELPEELKEGSVYIVQGEVTVE